VSPANRIPAELERYRIQAESIALFMSQKLSVAVPPKEYQDKKALLGYLEVWLGR
jgi:hypothetical protein